MAKEVTRIAKLQIIGGSAKPGPELAGLGINMGDFSKKFNDATVDRKGDVVPVQITVYKDKSYDFVLKTTPAAVLLKKAANVKLGAKNAKTETVATITKEQAVKIAEYKMPDLNANDLKGALKMIAGTAKNMGIKITGLEDDKKGDK